MKRRDEPAALFVYGSLLVASRREEILGRAVEVAAATIRDHERGRARFHYIRKRIGIDTPGLILVGLTARDFAALDRYEEVPTLYTREQTDVVDARGTTVRCWVYMPTARVFDSTIE